MYMITTCGDVHLLHHVAINGKAAIILGLLPLELAAFLVDIRHLQGALRPGWAVCLEEIRKC